MKIQHICFLFVLFCCIFPSCVDADGVNKERAVSSLSTKELAEWKHALGSPLGVDAAAANDQFKEVLGKLANLYDPSYDADLVLDWRWKRELRQRFPFWTRPPKFGTWLQTEVSNIESLQKSKIVDLIVLTGKSVFQSVNTSIADRQQFVAGLELQPAVARAIEDAALFYHFASVEDNWSDYLDIQKRHAEILEEADVRERLALNARMVRLMSLWNPITRGIGKDRIRFRTRCEFVGCCMNDESLQSVSTSWFRCFQIVYETEKLADQVQNMSDDQLADYQSGRFDENGVFHEGSPEDKRKMLRFVLCDASKILRNKIDTKCWRVVVGFPYVVVEAFADDVSTDLGLADKNSRTKFLEETDVRVSMASGDLDGFWQRKAIREGKPMDVALGRLSDSGFLDSYTPSDALRAEMSRYGLVAGAFVQKDSFIPGTTNRLAYLLFKPKGGGRVPLLLFVPGSGEMGFDLSRQFRQRTIFEKVTSAEFQKKHPCFLLVISPPEDCPDLCGYGLDMKPGKYQRPFLDALSAIIRAQKAPAVDTDRIYATGLSMGGRSIYGLSFVAPHLFAACVPVSSGVFSPEDVREERPGNWWHLYNEGDYARHPDSIPRLEAFAARVRELGGDFRIGTYPAEGHNAWDAAWREDALWDWLFSKSLANERSAAVGGVRPAKERKSDRSLDGTVVCTASKAGFDAKRGPERAADGLDATAYVSAAPMGPGDWWMCEFKEPVTGRIRVQTGLVDGTRRLSRGHVEVSKDGKLWSRAASVSQKTGEASFQQRDPIRFVKLLAEPRTPEVLTLRELRLE